ncbi:MAG: hypothetical protein ACTSV7_14990 [Candidatus Baldrarchaeia archaeon]
MGVTSIFELWLALKKEIREIPTGRAFTSPTKTPMLPARKLG